ncbi:hypothetical protein ENBRE01_2801 [Enteropsectra breve]|nr:hypothetical protein ENBRE01_2801 [Enteropsectra breve]
MIFATAELLTVIFASSRVVAADSQNPSTTHDLHSLPQDNHESQISNNESLTKLSENIKPKNIVDVSSVREDLDLYVEDLCKQYETLHAKHNVELENLMREIYGYKYFIQNATDILDSETINKITSQQRTDEYENILKVLRQTEFISMSLPNLKSDTLRFILEYRDIDDFDKTCPILVNNFKNDARTAFSIFQEICASSKELAKELEVINFKIFEEIDYARQAKKIEESQNTSGDDRSEVPNAMKWEREQVAEVYEDANRMKEFLKSSDGCIKIAIEYFYEIIGDISDLNCERAEKCKLLKANIKILPKNERKAYNEDLKAIKDSLKAKNKEYLKYNMDVSNLKDIRSKLEECQKQYVSDIKRCKALYEEADICVGKAKRIYTFVSETENFLVDIDSKLDSIKASVEEKTKNQSNEGEIQATKGAANQRPFWKTW